MSISVWWDVVNVVHDDAIPVRVIQQVGGEAEAQRSGRWAIGTRRQRPYDPITIAIGVFRIVGIPQIRIVVLCIGRAGAQIDLGAVRDVDDGFINVDAGRGAVIPGRCGRFIAAPRFRRHVGNRRRAGGVGQLQLFGVPPHVEQGDVAGIDRGGGLSAVIALSLRDRARAQGSGVLEKGRLPSAAGVRRRCCQR